MAFIRHFTKGGNNTAGVDIDNGEEFTEEVFIESDDPLDTGFACLLYLYAQGYTYGRQYNVGNDDLTGSTAHPTYLYRIEPPQLVAGSVSMWQTTMLYGTVTPGMQEYGGQPGDPGVTPPNRRPEISTSTVTREKIAQYGVYWGGLRRTSWEEGRKRVITNSADDPYSDPIIYESQHRIVRVVRPFPAVYVSDSTMPTDWINRDLIVLTDRKTTIRIAPFTMKLLSWSTQPAFEENTDFVMVTFEGEINPDGWRVLKRDTGLNELLFGSSSESGGQKRPALSNGEGRLNGPQDLDGRGQLLQDDDPHGPYFGIWAILDELDVRAMPFFAGMVF